MTSNRLTRTDHFAERVDGWLSLSGGQLGAVASTRSPPNGSSRASPSRSSR
ncbi:MAG: hypothetical protein JJE52_04740 [Acidimicrobiia bacterium]|nr:hypothetical protein [Acidimicrobiia bacterium]